MNINTDQILSLPASEKLQLIELLWENLDQSNESIELPEWIKQEANKRRDELLADPTIGITHEEIWKRVFGRHG